MKKIVYRRVFSLLYNMINITLLFTVSMFYGDVFFSQENHHIVRMLLWTLHLYLNSVLRTYTYKAVLHSRLLKKYIYICDYYFYYAK